MSFSLNYIAFIISLMQHVHLHIMRFVRAVFRLPHKYKIRVFFLLEHEQQQKKADKAACIKCKTCSELKYR